MIDLPSLYSATKRRVIDLVSPLSVPALATPVPGTPKWSVEQVIAHLAGVCRDLVSGNTDGVATEPWTARHVIERQGQALPEVLAEWQQWTPQLLAMLATPGRVDASAFDILTHEHDLRGALGLVGPSDPAAVSGVTARVCRRVHQLVDTGGLPALRLINDDGCWVCGSGSDGGVTGTATTIEWFRALFGRRSAAQIRTYQWDGDPGAYLGMLNLFGAVPEADVVEAGAPIP